MQLAPVPAAAPTAPPLTPKAPALPAPGGIAVPPAAGAPAPGGAPAPAGAPKAGAPAGGAPKPDLAALVSMPVADAVTAAGKQLAALQTMTVGGGTKEGAASAAAAVKLLKDTSMLVQLVHRNALPTQISPELEMNLMGISIGMAAVSTQVGLMGQASKEPIALKELLATPTKQALDVLAAVADHVGRAQQQVKNPSTAGYL